MYYSSSEFQQKIALDLERQKAYNDNIDSFSEVAANIPLLHTSGNETRHRISFDEILFSENPVLPTSEEKNRYCSEDTRDYEDILGLGRCLYFYAGRAHPSFGQIVLAFEPNIESKHTGSATPFDTGGVVNDKIQTNIKNFNDEAKKKFAQKYTSTLGRWRIDFGIYLAAFFESTRDYWFGRPYKVDKEELYEQKYGNKWRSWTYEIRFWEEQSVLESVKWCASESQTQRLHEGILARSPIVDSDLITFMDNALEPMGSLRYIEKMEEWARLRTNI